jgi:hypothetical protein
MTIKMRFDGKVFVPDQPVHLPPGTEVTVDLNQPPSPDSERPSLLEWMADNPLDDSALPADLAHQHDHYLYGTPKKEQ